MTTPNIPVPSEHLAGAFPAGKKWYQFFVELLRQIVILLFGFPNLKQFGAKGDGDTDDYNAFKLAIASGKGTFYIPEGTYLVGTPILVDVAGVSFMGAGKDLTTIKASHDDGPVIQFQKHNGGVSKLTIEATSARENGTAGTNCGILVAPTDTVGAGGHALNFVCDQVEITNQPSHALVLVGFTIGTRVSSFDFHDNIGHGIFVTNGEDYLGYSTGIYSGGFCELGPGNIKDNGGHSICVGGDGTTDDIPTRVHIFNVDSVRNALSAGVRNGAYDMWVFGSNCLIENCGIGGFDSNSDPAVVCLAVAGQSIIARNNRYVDHADEAVKVRDFPAVSASRGIFIDEMHIIQAGKGITNITQAATAVVTYEGSDIFANGDQVEIVSVAGMTEVNQRTFTVANLNTGANTFELSGINSTGYTAYTAPVPPATTNGTVRRQLDPAVSIEAGATRVMVASRDGANIWNLQRDDANENVPAAIHQRPELTVKRATETVNASDTLQNDDDFFTPVDAGESLVIKLVIAHVGDSTADFKCTFTAPTGGTIRWGPTGGQEEIGGTITHQARASQAGTLAFGGSTSARFVELVAYVKNGDTAGNVRFQWAQNTNTAVDTQVLGGSLGGSHMIVWRE